MHHPNLPWPHDLVIDHPDRVERLMDQLGAALPIPARPTPELQATLQDQRNVALPMDCRVTWISYAGEAGGIICKLVPAADLAAEAVFASIAHLRFDPRMPLALEIVVYQRHRMKRLRSQKLLLLQQRVLRPQRSMEVFLETRT